MKLRTIGICVSLAFVSIAAQAQTVGQFDSGNCYPFSCLASEPSGGTTYQEVYSATAFAGTTTFDTISFFQDPSWTGLMDSATYTIGFSTTSAAVGALDTTWANNIGGDSAFFGTFSLSGAMPAILSFTGNAFTYDPTLGNLLMTVSVDSLSTAHPYESGFMADYTGVEVSRLWAYGGSATGDGDVGALVTRFSSISPVPEPETYAMMLAGLGLLGFARKRRVT